MKDALNKTLLTLAGLVLVIPFAAVALLAGSQAVQVAPSANMKWLLVALALSGTILSTLTARQQESESRAHIKASAH
ncbi:MAG: hypothetical protein M3Q76_04930 [Acidobacteriota bacterium]|nr:hypothetical protein [Acidobacteriota bacterium]